MQKSTLLSLVFLFFTISLVGQTATQSNSWYMYFGNHKLNEKWGLHTEYQFRRHGLLKDWQQSLARVALDYKVNTSTMLTGGYGWIVSFPYGEQPISTHFNEHRIYQQLILKQKSGKLNFQHRYRFEQRFLENVELQENDVRVSDGHRFRQRFRYRALASIPIPFNSIGGKGFSLSVYEEIFLGFGEGIGVNILDQNRLFAGIRYKFSSSTNTQLGYLYHKVFKSDGLRQENNHTLQVALTHNFDFSQKKVE